jgi:hypothetical protein
MSVYDGGFGDVRRAKERASFFTRAIDDDDDALLTSSPLVCNYFF